MTIISLEEQMRGWLAYIARQRSFDEQVTAYARLQGLVDDYSPRIVFEFDSRAASEAQRLRKAKIRIGTMDLKIAAIALSTQSRLLTRNVADFRRVPGLQLEEWVD